MGIGSQAGKTPHRRPVTRNAHARQDRRYFGGGRQLARAIRRGADTARRRLAENLVWPGQLLARRAGAELEHPDHQRRRWDLARTQSARAQRRTERISHRSRPPRAAQRDARGHRLHRGDLQVRNQGRPRRRHHPADPGCRRRQQAQGLDAADRARRIKRLRGTARRPAPARQRLFARFPRPQLARPAQRIECLCRPRPDRAGDRRRPIRA